MQNLKNIRQTERKESRERSRKIRVERGICEGIWGGKVKYRSEGTQSKQNERKEDNEKEKEQRGETRKRKGGLSNMQKGFLPRHPRGM